MRHSTTSVDKTPSHPFEGVQGRIAGRGMRPGACPRCIGRRQLDIYRCIIANRSPSGGKRTLLQLPS